MRSRARLTPLALLAATALGLVGCGSDSSKATRDVGKATAVAVTPEPVGGVEERAADSSTETIPRAGHVWTTDADGPTETEIALRPRTPLTAEGVIRQLDDDPPVICFGPVAEAYPPECDGPLILGVDWEEMPNEHQAQNVRWGEARVVGTYDGQAFTLNRPPMPPTFPVEPDGGIGLDPYAQLCADPYVDGGVAWDGASEEAQAAHREAARLLEAESGYVSSYVSQGESVLNVLVVPGTDLVALRSELRGVWSGGLCLQSRSAPPRDAVYSAMDALGRASLPEIFSWSAAPEGGLNVNVLLADDDTVNAVHQVVSAYVDPGGVHINGALVPFDVRD
ncbi:MAG TPA: hypothetical protein VJ976_02890 [Ornithinimicrobium sp.]|uniref:hypothetical protein n=1 Tax=Ornithinimicrobium sp. TaxID=1977084 RepID=UPI002B4641B3|nr:hypothetical protein [Ornithinimicrobium sp.]HKJ11317.1 hypothetical protein [Ornithinimicrobium sp.]